MRPSRIRDKKMKVFNKDNFNDNTFAEFTHVNAPKREPDYISESSKYWFTSHGVYRESNHWNAWIGSCFWIIGNLYENLSVKCGFCHWKSFNALGFNGNKWQLPISKITFDKDSKTVIFE